MSAAAPPRVQVSGAPHERGVQLGRQAQERIGRTLALYRETFAHYTGLGWDEVCERAKAFQPAIDAYDAELLPEMAGTAEGAGVAFEDILAINTRTEVMYGFSGRMAAECTAFGARGSATENGEVLIGQNWDWLPPSSESAIVLEMEIPGRASFVTFVEAGLLAKVGFNDAGIGLVANLLLTDEDRGEPGVPFHAVLRNVLAARSFEEAVGAVTRARRASSGNYLIAGVDGDLADLEARPGGPDAVHRIDPTRDRVLHANTFCGPIGSASDRGIDALPDSPRRTARIEQLLDQHHGRLDAGVAGEMLRDHDGAPSSICRHADESLHPLERIMTIGSMVVELTASRMNLALGAPCEHGYETIVPEFARAGQVASR
jgi:isopenicillin-N N-acyltransferase-like protein